MIPSRNAAHVGEANSSWPAQQGQDYSRAREIAPQYPIYYTSYFD